MTTEAQNLKDGEVVNGQEQKETVSFLTSGERSRADESVW